MTPRKKKTYITLMATIGVAAVVDRCVIAKSGTPGSAAAVQIIVEAPAAELAETTDELTSAIPELHFPRTVKPFNPWAPMRDLFAPPVFQTATNGRTGNQAGRTADSSRPERLNRRDFEASITLNGVIHQQGLEIAVTDGKWLRVGQSIKGCSFIRVSGNTAVFECEDGKAVLAVKTGTAQGKD